MKIRSMSHEYRMNEQWYAMPPQCRKAYRDNLQALRQRERHLLNQFVEELVVEELGNDFDYWDAELEAAMNEWDSLFYERRTDRENCEWYGFDEPDEEWYDARFDELEKRIDIAYREWIEAA